MDQHVYNSIVADTIIPFAEDNMPLIWKFVHSNDFKHTLHLVKSEIEENNINIL